MNPPSPELPVLERGVRNDPVRCGYKGAEQSGACAQSTRLFTAAGSCRLSFSEISPLVQQNRVPQGDG